MSEMITEKEIMSSWKNTEPVVTIVCITFNQSSYIRDAMDGFLKQKTQYPFLIAVHDDCSTDGTLQILEEYEKRYPHIVVIYKESENQYSKGRKVFCDIMLPLVKTPFVAVCEGDDYWIDPDKLESQIRYLKNHDSCALVVHGHNKLLPNGNQILCTIEKERDITSEEIIENRISIATNTYVFRNGLVNLTSNIFTSSPVGDIPLRIMLSLEGSVHYFIQPMSVYRVNARNSWTERNKRDKNKAANILLRMVDLYNAIDMETKGKYQVILKDKIDNCLLDSFVLSHRHFGVKSLTYLFRNFSKQIQTRSMKFKVILLLKFFWFY